MIFEMFHKSIYAYVYAYELQKIKSYLYIGGWNVLMFKQSFYNKLLY